ncbi:unnamed protein product [Ectocarpus sp. 8 AP-2014]
MYDTASIFCVVSVRLMGRCVAFLPNGASTRCLSNSCSPKRGAKAERTYICTAIESCFSTIALLVNPPFFVGTLQEQRCCCCGFREQAETSSFSAVALWGVRIGAGGGTELLAAELRLVCCVYSFCGPCPVFFSLCPGFLCVSPLVGSEMVFGGRFRLRLWRFFAESCLIPLFMLIVIEVHVVRCLVVLLSV